jgi:hypothetical protein
LLVLQSFAIDTMMGQAVDGDCNGRQIVPSCRYRCWMYARGSSCAPFLAAL